MRMDRFPRFSTEGNCLLGSLPSLGCVKTCKNLVKLGYSGKLTARPENNTCCLVETCGNSISNPYLTGVYVNSLEGKTKNLDA